MDSAQLQAVRHLISGERVTLRGSDALSSHGSKLLHDIADTDALGKVQEYCFRFSICATFMPLSCSRNEFRIAFVWTSTRATCFLQYVFGSLSILFTRAFFTTIECRD